MSTTSAEPPVRVLFDAHQLGRHQTGNETYVRGLIEAFKGRDDVSLIAAIEDRATADDSVAGLEHRRVPRNGWLRLAAMSMAVRRDHADLVHAMYFGPVLAGKPVVLTVHDIAYEVHPEFFGRSELWRDRLLIRNSANRARFVVTVSETSRLEIIRRYDLEADRVIAIHNGVSPAFGSTPAPPIDAIGDRPVRVLAVGTLQPRKNLGRLLEAIRRAATVRPIELRVIGPDGFQARAIREAFGELAQVQVIGFVSDEELRDQYRQADMLVYPSLYEGFGLPVVEAMASGLPVITSTGGALPEIAGDAALIVDPLDELAIGDAILRLADDTDLRRALSRSGLARATQFSWETAADQLASVYRAAVDG